MRILIFFAFTLLLSGCGSILIERSEKLEGTKLRDARIICIDPRFYFQEDEANYDLEKVEDITGYLKRSILRHSKRMKLGLEINDFHSNPGPAFYQDFLRLRQNMLTVNMTQQTPLNFNRRTRPGEIQRKVFVYPPVLLHEFSDFSKKYGTPYFSFIGLYSGQGRLLLYHIIVDTDRAETVYREYKLVRSGVDKAVISQMVFDSFSMLKKELKK